MTDTFTASLLLFGIYISSLNLLTWSLMALDRARIRIKDNRVPRSLLLMCILGGGSPAALSSQSGQGPLMRAIILASFLAHLVAAGMVVVPEGSRLREGLLTLTRSVYGFDDRLRALIDPASGTKILRVFG